MRRASVSLLTAVPAVKRRMAHWVVFFVYWTYVDPRSWARAVWGYLKSLVRPRAS